jgi:hypothetical protein
MTTTPFTRETAKPKPRRKRKTSPVPAGKHRLNFVWDDEVCAMLTELAAADGLSLTGYLQMIIRQIHKS